MKQRRCPSGGAVDRVADCHGPQVNGVSLGGCHHFRINADVTLGQGRFGQGSRSGIHHRSRVFVAVKPV